MAKGWAAKKEKREVKTAYLNKKGPPIPQGPLSTKHINKRLKKSLISNGVNIQKNKNSIGFFIKNYTKRTESTRP